MGNEGTHKNEPRDVGYPKSQAKDYQEFTKDKSSTIFLELKQKDIFLLAFAFAFSKGKKFSSIKQKQPNIPLSVFSEDEKWVILSALISFNNDLLLLMNEKQIYDSAELFAAEGFELIKNYISEYGVNFDKFLEQELIKSIKHK
jgi:hypothetical protein